MTLHVDLKKSPETDSVGVDAGKDQFRCASTMICKRIDLS